MLVPSGRMRGNGHKVRYRKFHLYIRRIFFMVRVVKYRHRRTQGGCGVSLLGNVEKPSGHGPGQLALDGPA